MCYNDRNYVGFSFVKVNLCIYDNKISKKNLFLY